MINIPNNTSPICCLIGIDPGSTCVGISIMQVDVQTTHILGTNAFTIKLDKLSGNDWIAQNYGDRYRRISILKDTLAGIFVKERPFSIAIEAPFFNHFRPQAYGVLMEVMSAIKETVYEYDHWQLPYLIDPSSVKNAVGANGAAKKEIIHKKVLELSSVLHPVVDLQLLDEHSIDAIAVNYCRYKRLFTI